MKKVSLLIVVFGAMLTQAVLAQTAYELNTTGTSTWSTTTIWTPNGTPGANAGDTVSTAGVPSNSATVNLGASRTVAGLTIQANSSQVHTFQASAADQTLTVSGVLTKNSSGEGRIHNGSSLFSNFDVSIGSMSVNAGSMFLGTTTSSIDDLTVGNVSISGSTSLRLNVTNSANLGVITVGTGSTFNIANGPQTGTNSRTVTVTGIAGAGTVLNSNNSMSSGSTSGTLVISTSADQSFTGLVTNGGTGQTLHLSKTGAAQQTLGGTGANLYSGNTTVTSGTLRLDKTAGVNAIASGTIFMNAGTLLLNKANQIADGVNMQSTAAGSTFNTGGFNETLGTLDLNANLTLNLGAGTSALAFSDSSGIDWGLSTLTILGWTSGSDTLRFGTSSSALTVAQLASISFSGSPSGAQIDASGYITPIPEPSVAAILGLTLTLFVVFRRRSISARSRMK